MLASKALLLGLLLGVRHAIEPDHLAAITTMIPDARSAAGAARTGALWGLGHAIAIVIFGSILVAMGITVPVKVAFMFEVAVAVMLVLLGVTALRGRKHVHKGRSTLVGFIHGVSGTGAITLLCVTTLPSPRIAIAFLVVFALGALVSMSAMSGLLAAPLTAIAKKGDGAMR
ncbi:MAG: HoxN/HupN/NixA family nickel/cobalt transporter, partial [Polyangiales bacterium]